MNIESNAAVPEPSLKPAPEPTSEPTRASLTQFVGYFLWLGTVGFGGPIALAGHMQQDLVDARGWVRKEDYLEGLALAQLAPARLLPNSRFISVTSAQVCSEPQPWGWHSSCPRS